MNNVQGNNDQSRQNGRAGGAHVGRRERVDQARDLVETVRDRAEIAFRDRPYLLPVAAGAVGLGVGVLLGSKLTRLVVFAAVGTLVSEALGGEIKRISKDFMEDLHARLGNDDAEEV